MALHDDHRANVVDIGDHEAQWLTLFTGPADHQKRRHIDLNEEPKYKSPSMSKSCEVAATQLQDF
ncbi:TMV resistance protein N-like [Prunus yedoensis var. nudiflora]|uniref:TMV resistance protein N-like n=1 Tax=Prunus yedoensis var. nudiflora TaxID=2094558 RepID=A0A314UKI4_PRUYE|nr:TMV resistance protein N-like [Prunus yedoensis var. nudiflora]